MIHKIIQESRKLGLPTRRRERALIKRAQAGDDGAREHLLIVHSPFVMDQAMRLSGRGLETKDCWSCGMRGLDIGITRFDLTKFSAKLITYAAHWIRQQILFEIGRYGSMIRVPVNRVPALFAVRDAARNSDDSGEPIDEQAIMDEHGLSTQDFKNIMWMCRDMSSLNMPADGSTGPKAGPMLLQELIPDPRNNDKIGDALEVEWLDRMCRETLTPREYKVIIGRFVHDKTLNEIGKDMMFSRERIRQIERDSLLKLRFKLRRIDRETGITPTQRAEINTLGAVYGVNQ